MIQNCVYDPIRDVESVSPEGALDLAKAYALGSVPANLSASEVQYNQIEDPASIMGKPSDVFEGMQYERIVREHGVKKVETPTE